MNAYNKFDGKAENYALSRPSYSLELIDYLYYNYSLSDKTVFADIGSGTGKLSKLLLDRNSEVYCVEPNNEMRLVAQRELAAYTRFHSVAGNAENTALYDNSVDCITAAQSFHWFDTIKFKKECLRITKENGFVFLIWNIRDPSDSFNKQWQDIFSHYCPNFKGFSNGIKQDDLSIKAFFDNNYKYISFEHPLILDKKSFIKRSLSSSYSLTQADKGYQDYIASLNELFDRHKTDDELVTISNKSVAYCGTTNNK